MEEEAMTREDNLHHQEVGNGEMKNVQTTFVPDTDGPWEIADVEESLPKDDPKKDTSK